MNKIYYQRILDELIEKRLRRSGAVLIEGPKWCGKTTTARQHAKSVLELQNPDTFNNYLNIADIAPSRLLEGERPRLIDEWQSIPVLWDSVRTEVDNSIGGGHFILTASRGVEIPKVKHSGIGRISRITMYPMSLYESRESNGKLSILDLFKNPDIDLSNVNCDLTFEELAFVICRGGWPESLFCNKNDSLEVVKDYVYNICHQDMSSIDKVKRDSRKVKSILKSYACNNSHLLLKKQFMKTLILTCHILHLMIMLKHYINSLLL